MSLRVGVVGLGAMGGPMALNLAGAGHLACAWNRTPGRFAALGLPATVHAATGPADVATRADLLILSVSRDEDVRAVVDAMRPALRPGSILVDTSTVSASTARALAAELSAREVAFLDAPVSGGVEGARHARLAMMVGGDAEALARARPVLAAIAATVVHMGPSGAGQATKAVNQIMAAGINQAVTEALAFGAAMELDLGRVIDVVSRGAAANWFLEHRGPTMVRGSYAPGFKVALHHKDLTICREMAAAASGIALPIVEMTLHHYERLMAEGYGEEDISALHRVKVSRHG